MKAAVWRPTSAIVVLYVEKDNANVQPAIKLSIKSRNVSKMKVRIT